MNIFSVPARLLQLHCNLQVQKRFNKGWLLPLLKKLEHQHQGNFTLPQRKKIQQYYTLFVPVFLCAAFRKLQEQAFTHQDRENAVLMGIITPLYDDFFDEGNISLQQIEQLTLQPQSFPAHQFEEKVVQDLHCTLLETVPDPRGYLFAFNKVLQSQIGSLQQLQATQDAGSLLNITYQKSADALLLYRHLLGEVPHWFEQVIYPAAGLLQLSNDLFDVYKDVQEGIHTPTNHHPDFQQLQQLFWKDARAFNQLVLDLPYAVTAKKEFLFTLYAIIARGYVALLHLNKATKRNKAAADVASMTRKELVCDMQRPANIIKWIYYIKKFTSLK